MTRLNAVQVLLVGVVLLLVIPPVIFVLVALYSEMPLPETVDALAFQYVTERINLAVVSAVGLLPLLLLSLLLFIRSRFRRHRENTSLYALGGLLPIVAVTVFVHMEYWPAYLPARQFLGFPHGLEFTIGPLVFAPIGMLIGLVIVRAVLAGRA